MSNPPWYHKGLKFRCTGCGDCCTGEPGFVWVNPAEIEALAEAVGLPLDQFLKKYTRTQGVRRSLIELANGDCVFFDAKSRKCAVYLDRPRQCRTWPFWESNLATPADWSETGEFCPGVGKGRLVAREVIESRLGEIRV